MTPVYRHGGNKDLVFTEYWVSFLKAKSGFILRQGEKELIPQPPSPLSRKHYEKRVVEDKQGIQQRCLESYPERNDSFIGEHKGWGSGERTVMAL